MASPARNNAKATLNHIEMQMEQDRQVNDMLNEIDDHLEDENSDEEDSSYLVNANSSTGGPLEKQGSPAANLKGGQLAQSYFITPEKESH